MNNTLLVGDCIATGFNCLMHEIIQEETVVMSDLQRFTKFEQPIVKWFLQKNKDKINFEEIVDKAYAYKRQYEINVAWPSYFKNPIKNLAVFGETYEGMLIKTKQYIAEYGKPNLIIITDFTESHHGNYVNLNNKEYYVKRDRQLLDEPQKTWPNDVYNIFKEKVKEELQYDSTYHYKKHQKELESVIEYLTKNNLNYKFCIFREWTKKIVNNIDYIDCIFLTERYITNANNGEEVDTKIKYQTQKLIANYIEKRL